MKEIHIEMPMLLKSLQLRIEQLVDILIIPSLTCFLRKLIDDWMQVREGIFPETFSSHPHHDLLDKSLPLTVVFG